MECFNNGCGNNSNIFFLIILLFLFNGNCGCGCDNNCGVSLANSGCGNSCSNNNCGCGFFGGDNSCWIILLLLFCSCR